MHILLLTKNHCSYFVVTISGSFLTHFSLYARRLVALFFVTSVSPNSSFEMRAFHIVFLQIWQQKLREVKQLVWGHTAVRGLRVWHQSPCLKHPSILLHPWKHNIAKLICKCIFCDLKGRVIFFLMGKSKDVSWLIGAEDLVTFLADLAQVHSES